MVYLLRNTLLSSLLVIEEGEVKVTNATVFSSFNTALIPIFYNTMLSSDSSALNCSANLTNTVVYEGSSAFFGRLSNGEPVQWTIASSSDFWNAQKMVTNYDDIVASPYSSAFAVDCTGLTVFKASVAAQGSMPYATAGLYTVKYKNSSCAYAANLIVISKSCQYHAKLISSLYKSYRHFILSTVELGTREVRSRKA